VRLASTATYLYIIFWATLFVCGLRQAGLYGYQKRNASSGFLISLSPSAISACIARVAARSAAPRGEGGQDSGRLTAMARRLHCHRSMRRIALFHCAALRAAWRIGMFGSCSGRAQWRVGRVGMGGHHHARQRSSGLGCCPAPACTALAALHRRDNALAINGSTPWMERTTADKRHVPTGICLRRHIRPQAANAHAAAYALLPRARHAGAVIHALPRGLCRRKAPRLKRTPT